MTELPEIERTLDTLSTMVNTELDYWMCRTRRTKILLHIEAVDSDMICVRRSAQDRNTRLYLYLMAEKKLLTPLRLKGCFRTREGATKEEVAAKHRHVARLWALLMQQSLRLLAELPTTGAAEPPPDISVT